MNFLGDHGMGQGQTVADYLRLTYWDDVDLGVAWFIAALLAFSLAYAAWRWRHPVRTEGMMPLRGSDLVKGVCSSPWRRFLSDSSSRSSARKTCGR
jgi:hypothetical protein